MTHFKIDIQLPLNFNPEKGEKTAKQIPPNLFHDTYEELLGMCGGINTTNQPIIGSWISQKTKRRYDDRSIVFSVVVESQDKMTILNVPKIKKLQKYKNKLKIRFKQEEIFMVATRCTWI